MFTATKKESAELLLLTSESLKYAIDWIIYLHVFHVCHLINVSGENSKTPVLKLYSTTVIAKIKGMPRSLFYVIPRYVTMDYEK